MKVLKIRKMSELTDVEISKLLTWWSLGTQQEEYTISETPESLKESLLDAAVAYFDGEIVGAAGIFPARTKSGEHIFFKEKLIVELGSNYVDPFYRNNGLGRELLLFRFKLIKEKGIWFPVSITTNPIVKKIFINLGAKTMDNFPEFTEIRKKLCICDIILPSCKSCPLHENASWFFPGF